MKKTIGISVPCGLDVEIEVNGEVVFPVHQKKGVDVLVPKNDFVPVQVNLGQTLTIGFADDDFILDPFETVKPLDEENGPRVGSLENPAVSKYNLPDRTGIVKNFYGDIEYYVEGRLHREDGPAVEKSNGTLCWYKDGKLHREDGPAVVSPNGTEEYFFNGVLHRENGPAVIKVDGTKRWYKDGKRHREDGPAIVFPDGSCYFYQNDVLHRVDGPAVEKADGRIRYYINGVNMDRKHFMDHRLVREFFAGKVGSVQNPAKALDELPDGTGLVVYADGDKHWYKNGALHRVDGPAIEYANGEKAWFQNGEKMTEAEFLVATQKNGKNDPEGTANTTDSVITSDEFPLGSVQNPAKNRAELPDGTGVMVNFYGTKFWYKNGKLHREDGPAIENIDGSKDWCVNGKLHREDGPAVEWANGTKKWWVNGELHREDGPAIEYSNGEKEWFQNGVLHREDGPAVDLNRSKEYWVHGERMTEAEFIERSKATAKTTDSAITPDEFPLGSVQNPAKDQAELPDGTGLVVNGRGTKFWYLNGQWHREDGPALECSNGEKEWYKNGERHREDGPAVEWANGYKEWYRGGELHREDGPAIEYSNGEEWYKNGVLHRENGPAVDLNGYKEYWVHGERMTEAEFIEWSKATAKDTDSIVNP